MRVHVTVTYEYQIPDDLEEREEMYGTIDPKECVAIDLDNGGLFDIAEFSDVVNVQTDIVETT